MLDSELKQELDKIHREFQKVDVRLVTIDQRLEKVDKHLNAQDSRMDMMQDTVEGLARCTAEGFEEIDERFDKLEVKLQNQIDEIAQRKVDRAEFAPIKARVLNLQSN